MAQLHSTSLCFGITIRPYSFGHFAVVTIAHPDARTHKFVSSIFILSTPDLTILILVFTSPQAEVS